MSSPPATPPAKTPSTRKEERFEETGDPCEWSEDYRPGGFHPIHLGDTFKNGQYRVIRKLGYGSFSTVWLVVDNIYARYVSLKVMMSKQSSTSDTELHICCQLAEGGPSNTPQSKHVVMLLDSFEHVGPNGAHQCLVYEPMGGTVASMVETLPMNQITHPEQIVRYPMWMAKRILKHALSGLAVLHQNGIVHGDVQPGNFLFSASGIDLLGENELRQSESQIAAPLQRLDGKVDRWAPKHLMLAQPLFEYADLGPGMSIKISDFGAAFWSSNPPEKTVSPVALRAPELIFGEPFGSAIDIWSFGCLIYELLTGLQLFGVWMMGVDTQEEADDDHLLELNDVLEPLPDSWLAKWPRSHMYLGPNRERLNPHTDEDDEYGGFSGLDDGQDDEGSVEDSKKANDADGDVVPLDGDRENTNDSGGFTEAIDANPISKEGDGPFINDPLEAQFEKNKPAEMSTGEAQVVTSLIRQILRYDPSERPTAAQLLEHEWFRDE